jgi:hypothetical protein
MNELIEAGIKGIEGLCGRELAACDRWLDFVLSSAQPWRGDPLNESEGADNILVALFARSVNTYWGAIELARMGFGEQALMLNRSLFEDMVDVHWVTVEPAIARERFEQRFEHAKMIFAAAASDYPDLFEPDAIPSFDPADRAKLDGVFGKYGDSSWTGVGIHQRVGAIEGLWEDEEGRRLLHFFRRIVYRDSNQQLHPSAQALNALVRSSDDHELALKVGPGPEAVQRALWSAYWSSIQIVSLVFQHFNFPEDALEGMHSMVRDANLTRLPP